MDLSLLDICKYIGNKRTALNKNEFVRCSECSGHTHKTLGEETKDVPAQNLLQREGYRCSHCGSTLEIEET